MWYRIVPLPLIFLPDLETDGFWSVKTGATSRSFGSDSTLTTGTSLLSKNLFSGTGGISSGRTTGLSLFVLKSTDFLSFTSLLSEWLPLWFDIRLHLGSSFFLSSLLRFLDCLILVLLLRFLLLLFSFSTSLSDEDSEEVDELEEESEASE